MTGLRLSFLGHPEVEQQGKTLKLGVKPMLLLAYLALEGPTPRQTLGKLLWPEAENPRGNLSVARNSLLKVLGAHALSGDPETLALEVAFDCDVPRWRAGAARADAGVWELWRGGFLSGMRLTDWEMGLGEELEDWLYGTRETLREERRDFASRLAALELSEGRLEAALPYLEAAQGESGDPQEDATRWLMLTLGALHRPDEAAQVYARLVQTLRTDLGVEPTAASREALETVRSGGPQRCVAALEAELGSARAAVATLSLSPFVGRAREQALLQGALTAERGAVRAAVIQGEPGAGKSRLAAEVLAALPPGLRHAQGVCVQGGLPLAALDAPARALLRERPGLFATLPTDWQGALARFLPDLLSSADLPLSPDLERRNLFSALRSLLEDPHHPSLLLLDDLQWADASTLEFLHTLIASPPPAGLLLLFTQRNTEGFRADGAALLERIRRLNLGPILALEGLDEAPIRDLLEQLHLEGDPETLHRMSGGNPFYLLELLRASGDEGTARVHDLVRSRLEHLPDPARQVLEALAVLGDGAGLSLLRKVSGRSLEESADALDVLEGAALLRGGEQGMAFGHDLVRETVIEDTRAVRRSLLNIRAARARREFPLRAAQHYWLSQDAWDDEDQPGAKAAFLASSATFALRGELDEALAWSERAEALAEGEGERLERTLERAAILERYGRYPEATALLQRVEALLDAEQHPRVLAQALTLRAKQHQVEQGDHVTARRLTTEALTLLEGARDPHGLGLRGDALAVAGYAAYKLGHLEQALELNEQGLQVRRQGGDHGKIAGALSNLAMVLDAKGDDRAETHYLESLRVHEELYDVASIARTRTNLGTYYYSRQKLDEAYTSFQQALIHFELAGDSEGISQASSNVGTILFLWGRYSEALTIYKRALPSMRDIHARRTLLYNILETHVYLDDVDSARDVISELIEAHDEGSKCCAHYHEALDLACRIVRQGKNFVDRTTGSQGEHLRDLFTPILEQLAQLEANLTREAQALAIRVDEEDKAHQVEEITKSERFLELREKARALRERRAASV